MGDGLVVDQDMYCAKGFNAEGAVRLLGAHIRGQLAFVGGMLNNPGGMALQADGLIVDRAVLCSRMIAEGQVRLFGAHIGDQLAFVDASLRDPDGLAVDLERAEIEGYVLMRPTVLEGAIDLTFTRVGAWQDEARTWPRAIRLTGFTYTAIAARPPVTVADRLSWLRRDPAGYLPQPYEQLAETYRREGHDDHARQVLIAKQWHRRASHTSRWRRWPAITWSAVLRATIGYGYRPSLVLGYAAVLFIGGWWLFTRDHDQQHIVPTDQPPKPTPTFNAARYTADLLLPVANLGDRAKFTAVGDAAWHAFAFTLAGWLLAIVLVAGLTGVFKRD
jgi:hypothetical protein